MASHPIVVSNSSQGELEFRTYYREYMKPEEFLARSVVSEPLDIVCYSSDGLEKESAYWAQIIGACRCLLDPTLGAALNPLSRDDKRGLEMRLVIITETQGDIVPPNLSHQERNRFLFSYGYISDSDEDEPFDMEKWWMEVPMKLKLIPNYFYDDQRSLKENSCIARLAEVLKLQSIKLIDYAPADQGGKSRSRPMIFNLSEFTWNKEELAWEAETKVLCRAIYTSIQQFGQLPFSLWSSKPRIYFELKNETISVALQSKFGPGLQCNSYRRFLQEEVNPDLVIVDRDGDSVKCHQLPVMGASSRFAEMLDQSRGWKEGQTQTVKLAMSKEAVVAMLHFIYYGGTERILGGSATTALELLQIGHLYEIQKLVEATTIILMIKPEVEFAVAEIWDIFHFARTIPEETLCWKDLQKKCGGIFFIRRKDPELVASEQYQNLVGVALEIGPALVALVKLTMPDETKGLSINFGNTSKENCRLLYDYLKFLKDHVPRVFAKFPCNFILAMVLLAEHCNCEPPALETDIWNLLLRKPAKWFEIDHLVALFTLACQNDSAQLAEVKIFTARKLKLYKLNKPESIQASAKYKEMMNKNCKAAMELENLFVQLGN